MRFPALVEFVLRGEWPFFETGTSLLFLRSLEEYHASSCTTRSSTCLAVHVNEHSAIDTKYIRETLNLVVPSRPPTL
jgi:hypothetical protein